MSVNAMLFDWQKKIVDKFKHRKSFGLFLDMGLGKTPVSLGFAEANKCTKIIIVSINAKAIESEKVKGSWLWWANNMEMSYVHHDKWSKVFDNNKPEILIVNYESLFKRRGKSSIKTARIELKENIEEFINSCKGHNTAIIVDESHKVKNLQSQQTLSIIAIQKQLRLKTSNVYTYLLTGTPFTTGYIDLYTQLKILGHEGTKGQFVDNFCKLGNVPGLLGWQQPIVGYKNVDKLFDLIHQYAITIKSEDVTHLPEKIFVEHPTKMSEAFKMFIQETISGQKIIEYCKKRKITLTPEEFEKYNVDKKVNNPFFRNIAFPELKWLAETTGTYWMRCRQLSIGFQGNTAESIWFDRTRLDDVAKFLEEYPNNYLLFYNYTPELLELYEICDKLGYNIDVYCGECKSMVFYNKWSNLNDEEKLVTPKKNIILANFASGSTGMNWQEYSQCILFSEPLYKDYEQGIKRINRTGQKETTVYHEFYQENWLDKSMKNALNSSIQYSNEMFEADLKRVQELLAKEDE